MSQGTYTVSTQPVQGRTYENKKGGGNLTVWRLGLKDAESAASDNLFELHMKEGNTPPQVGEEIEVDRFFPGEFQGEGFTRIKRAYQQAGGSSSSGGGDSKNFDRRPEHPRNEARMIHTSALSAAPAYYELLRTEGVIPKAESKAAALNTLQGIAQWLADSYQPALSATEAAPQSQLQQEIPADTEGLGNGAGATTADQSVPF